MHKTPIDPIMNQGNAATFRDINLPDIGKDIGLEQYPAGLLVYDSQQHPNDFIRKKPFRSGHFSVILIIKGSMTIKVNFFEYSLAEKEVLIVPPNAIREMLWEDHGIHFISLLFTTDFLKEAGILGQYFNISPFLKEGMASISTITDADHTLLVQLIHIISGLENDVHGHADNNAVVHNLFRALLLKVKQYFGRIDQDTQISKSIVYRFINLLSQHYLSHRNINFYAGQLNINEKYLTQLLKRKTGKTARQFITEMVILEAKVLLNENLLSVKEIAEKLHFENQFHFSRFFKQYAGQSPTTYKKG